MPYPSLSPESSRRWSEVAPGCVVGQVQESTGHLQVWSGLGCVFSAVERSTTSCSSPCTVDFPALPAVKSGYCSTGQGGDATKADDWHFSLRASSTALVSVVVEQHSSLRSMTNRCAASGWLDRPRNEESGLLATPTRHDTTDQSLKMTTNLCPSSGRSPAASFTQRCRDLGVAGWPSGGVDPTSWQLANRSMHSAGYPPHRAALRQRRVHVAPWAETGMYVVVRPLSGSRRYTTLPSSVSSRHRFLQQPSNYGNPRSGIVKPDLVVNLAIMHHNSILSCLSSSWRAEA
ncbi:hypothetical protein B0H65DRAFT_225513 [Neurospora tetraspora]|uniref:Uncharacterized protein n=1 Tax=Neurospora tetraspora TaxID=94610 RepID=A0AAE0MQD5_9PEZI|nr:hypothetical protein B0H65DRAFT_225513 [Neurospora tetraspora]